MSNLTYSSLTLFLAALLVWQLVSGQALGSAWFRSPTRQDSPVAYWFVVATQAAILIAFVVTGKGWHLR
jgi:uncharacterized membrane protein